MFQVYMLLFFFFFGFPDLTNFSRLMDPNWSQSHGTRVYSRYLQQCNPARRPLCSRWAMRGWPGSREARGKAKWTDAAGKDNSTLKGRKVPKSPRGFICVTGKWPRSRGEPRCSGKQGRNSATRAVSFTETNAMGTQREITENRDPCCFVNHCTPGT